MAVPRDEQGQKPWLSKWCQAIKFSEDAFPHTWLNDLIGLDRYTNYVCRFKSLSGDCISSLIWIHVLGTDTWSFSIWAVLACGRTRISARFRHRHPKKLVDRPSPRDEQVPNIWPLLFVYLGLESREFCCCTCAPKLFRFSFSLSPGWFISIEICHRLRLLALKRWGHLPSSFRLTLHVALAFAHLDPEEFSWTAPRPTRFLKLKETNKSLCQPIASCRCIE